MKELSGNPRSRALDALRGVAIGLVVSNHFGRQWAHFDPSIFGGILDSAVNLAWSGVDLFFVLSGYLIGGILMDQRGSEGFFSTFYWRRAFRILPLYAVLLCGLALTSEISLWPYATFTQNIVSAISGDWNMPAGVSVTWSLAVEEQFYLVLPALIWLTPSRLLPRICLALAVTAIVCRAVAVLWFGNHHAAYVLMPCRMDDLFLGVLAAWMVRQPIVLYNLQAARRALLMIVSGLGAVFIALSAAGIDYHATMMQIAGYSFMAVFYFVTLLFIVTGKHHTKSPAIDVLASLGIGAYSIYLFHSPVIEAARALLGPGRAAVLISMPVTLAIAWALWIAIEKPFIGKGREWFRYRRAAVAP